MLWYFGVDLYMLALLLSCLRCCLVISRHGPTKSPPGRSTAHPTETPLTRLTDCLRRWSGYRLLTRVESKVEDREVREGKAKASKGSTQLIAHRLVFSYALAALCYVAPAVAVQMYIGLLLASITLHYSHYSNCMPL